MSGEVRQRCRRLVIGIWIFLGIWSLVIGICDRRRRRPKKMLFRHARPLCSPQDLRTANRQLAGAPIISGFDRSVRYAESNTHRGKRPRQREWSTVAAQDEASLVNPGRSPALQAISRGWHRDIGGRVGSGDAALETSAARAGLGACAGPAFAPGT